MTTGGPSGYWRGSLMAFAVSADRVPDGLIVLSSLQVEAGSNLQKMHSHGNFLLTHTLAELECARRSAGNAEDSNVVDFFVFPLASGPRCASASDWIASCRLGEANNRRFESHPLLRSWL